MSQMTQAATDATLTEYLPAAQNGDPSINGPAKLTYIKVAGTWQVDDGAEIAEPDEYRVECSCGEEFATWGAATAHAETEHADAGDDEDEPECIHCGATDDGHVTVRVEETADGTHKTVCDVCEPQDDA